MKVRMRKSFTRLKRTIVVSGIMLFAGISCKKTSLEPNIAGTWREMKSPADTSLTGCTLEIDQKNGDVSYCGIPVVHPRDVLAYVIKTPAKLFARNGQMYYREEKEDVFYVVPVLYDNLYFMDYEFDGPYLWVIGDASKNKVPVKGAPGAKIFRR
jgi:hypothetical protein